MFSFLPGLGQRPDLVVNVVLDRNNASVEVRTSFRANIDCSVSRMQFIQERMVRNESRVSLRWLVAAYRSNFADLDPAIELLPNERLKII